MPAALFTVWTEVGSADLVLMCLLCPGFSWVHYGSIGQLCVL